MTNLQRAIAEFQTLLVQDPPDREAAAATDDVGDYMGTLFLMVKENALARGRLTRSTAQEIEAVIAGWWDQPLAARMAAQGLVDHLALRHRADRDLQELVG